MSRTAPGTERTARTARPAVPRGAGASLRRRREELGLSLEEVAKATRIPPQHLAAMEADRFDRLPAGPYAQAYLKAVEDHLGAAVELTEPPPPPPPPRAIPLPVVRWIAVGSVVAMFVAMFVNGRVVPGAAAPAAPVVPPPPAPDQHVVVTARRTVDLEVRVDGELVLDRNVAGGEVLPFDGFDRIELDLPGLDGVKIEFNGSTIVPQGRQDGPRRLVFVDDDARTGG